MRQSYIDKTFHQASLSLINAMNEIMDEYEKQGFCLTVRQIYYQLVTRNLIANSEKEYERITRLCNDARLAGYMDWDMLEDRTREFIERPRWESGAQILNVAAAGYHQDHWARQPSRIFCIVAKDALAGVLEPVCRELDIPLLAARGYPSVTVLHDFATREIIPAMDGGQEVLILHLGDHDPSGIDMTRDLRERLRLFTRCDVAIQRIALNLDQAQEHALPPNPAKTSDKRFAEYAKKYGDESWELDALPPDYLAQLVRHNALRHIDHAQWEETGAAIAETKAKLNRIANIWEATS